MDHDGHHPDCDGNCGGEGFPVDFAQIMSGGLHMAAAVRFYESNGTTDVTLIEEGRPDDETMTALFAKTSETVAEPQDNGLGLMVLPSVLIHHLAEEIIEWRGIVHDFAEASVDELAADALSADELAQIASGLASERQPFDQDAC